MKRIMETEFVFFAGDELMELALFTARTGMFIRDCEQLITDPTKIGVPPMYFTWLAPDQYNTIQDAIGHGALKAFLGLALEKGSIDQAIPLLSDESLQYYNDFFEPARVVATFEYLAATPKETI